jgi:tetratricopeptide (TPR) repeat protein
LRWLGTPRPGQRTLAVNAHTTVAEGYSKLGELASSIAEYESAMRETEAMGREHTTNASITMNNLAEKYSKAGQAVQAVEWYRRALETAQEAEGDANANALAEANYASSLFDNGRNAEALAHFDHAYETSLRLNEKLWAAYIQVMGAPALCATADLVRCANWIDGARRALPPLMPAGHTIFGVLEFAAARLEMAKGAPAAARSHLLQGLKIMSTNPEPRPSVVNALALLARCEQQLGNNAAARDTADRAVSMAQALHTGFAQTAWIGSALLARAVVLEAQGDAVAAKAALLQAQVHLDTAAGPTAASTLEAHALLAQLDAKTLRNTP